MRSYRKALELWESEDRSSLGDDPGTWDQATRNLWNEADRPPTEHSREPAPQPQMPRWNAAASAAWEAWLEAGVRKYFDENLSEPIGKAIDQLVEEMATLCGTRHGELERDLRKEIAELRSELEAARPKKKARVQAAENDIIDLPDWRRAS
jgi:hypothetical protein